MYLSKCFGIVIIIITLSGCGDFISDSDSATQVIDKQDMLGYINELASDDYQGRKPCSLGEEKSISYITTLYQNLGLVPGNNGSYLQEVPLVTVTVEPDKEMKFSSDKQSLSLEYMEEFVAFSQQLVDKIEIESADVVFAGYGIVAPEYSWNDYEGLDVKDKIVIVMVNDPGFGTNNLEHFNGNSMTYYGRWTYKYEEAARQGAKGLLIIHKTKPAGYPWSVVLNGAIIPNLYLEPQDNYMSRCALEGWITEDAAKKLFEFSGQNYDDITSKAKLPDFKPVELSIDLDFNMTSTHTFAKSYNVLGLIEGIERPDEVIIYTAHWDHLGIGKPENNDSIYNGAVDNGTTLAWMFEIAQAFKSLENPPKRSVLFIATTAEEQGLLGAKFYTENPVFELNKTVANLNNDLMLPYGRYKDVMVTGFGQSELEEYVEKYAKEQDRYILPDPNPHTGMYYRADHFPFAKAGIPALFARGNCDSREHGKEWAAQMEADYLENHYHKPADEIEDMWDLSGIVEDAVLQFKIGYELANSNTFPNWKEGSEFKALRDKMMNE